MCRRVAVKKAWAVHLAELQQKQQQGSDTEEEEAQDAEPSPADAAEVHCRLSSRLEQSSSLDGLIQTIIMFPPLLGCCASAIQKCSLQQLAQPAAPLNTPLTQCVR